MSETPPVDTPHTPFEDAPTLELPPTTPPAPLDPHSPEAAARPELIPVDVNRDTLTQLQDFATSRGRENIELVQYEKDGMRYEVSRHETRQSELTKPEKKSRRILPSFSRQVGGSHTIEHVPIDDPREAEYVTVKGYTPNGDLGSVQTIKAWGAAEITPKDPEHFITQGSKQHTFQSFLNEAVADGQITAFRLGKELSPEETKEIPVDLGDTTKSVLDTARDTLARQGMPDDLTGLTCRRDGNTWKLVEDNARSWSTASGQRTQRDYIIEITNPENKVVSRYKQSEDELRKTLQSMANSQNQPLADLHFVKPKTAEYLDRDSLDAHEKMGRWFDRYEIEMDR
jgi:hypothetical protein